VGIQGSVPDTVDAEIDDQPPRRVDEVLDGVRVAMLTTQTADGLEARPLTVVEQHNDTVWFLVSLHAHWVVDATGSARPALLTFEDARHATYVSLVGRVRRDDDTARVRDLWTSPAKAYFDGPDDPDLVALAFDVVGGRWWDGPDSRIGQSLALARAIVSHDASKVGDVGPVQTDAAAT
jgi:general stress protein 26